MAVEQDPGGSLIPEDEAPIDPNDTLAGLEATLDDPEVFGDVGDDGDATLVVTEPLPVGRGWAWDFVENRFVVGQSRSPLGIRGVEVLRQRLEWCLRIARGAHPIFSAEFGMDDPWALMGLPIEEALSSDIGSRIEEALLRDPKVRAVEDMTFQVDPDEANAIMASMNIRTDDDLIVGFQTRLT